MTRNPFRGGNRPISALFSALCGAAQLGLWNAPSLRAQPYDVAPSTLDTVRFHLVNIADTTDPYDTFEKLTNLPHALTKESVPRHGVELTLGQYDTLNAHAFDEYEEYLRDLGVFSSIQFELETWAAEERGKKKSLPKTDLFVRTEDSWSLVLEPYNDPPDERTAWMLVEQNLLGYAKRLGIGGDLQSPGDSLWRGLLTYRDPNLFGTSLQLDGRLVWSRPQKKLDLELDRPFYSDLTRRAYGGTFRWGDGEDRFYFHDRTPGAELFYSSDTNRSTRYDVNGWIGFSNHDNDAFRFAASIGYNRLDLESGTAYPRAFENSVGFFVGLSSLRRKFARIRDYEFTGTRLAPIGAQGRISIGKISPTNGGLDNVVYFGAEAEQSVLWGDFYGYASIQAGTGLRQKQAQFTLQRATASGALPLGPGVAAARIEQSTIWRWPRYVILALGQVEGGVRGYDYLDVFGDSRIIVNLEYRLFPVANLWLWDLGLAAFYDVGGVWDQGQQFTSARFHSGAGLGVRLGKSNGIDAGFVRVDVAWNFDRGEIGRVDFGIREAFDIFGTLDFVPPGPYIP